MNSVRVRIAPSPTGYLHIGTARTALFNWVFARQNKGVFVVRIEDTDRERSKPEFEKDILQNLSWLGLEPEELHRQSERTEIYKKYLRKLLQEKKAFYCKHTIEELEKESEAQRKAKEPPRHFCAYRDNAAEEGIIRFRNDLEDTILVKDIVRGEVKYNPKLLGDFSIAKKIDEPLYNFAAVIDDFEMKISHVIRGEDHLPNTPKQILVGVALGLAEPFWAHLPLLLGSDRSKLSKRHGARSVNEYNESGYLPEAFINFIALLGWHPQDEIGEILDIDTLIKEFSLEKIQKGGAIVMPEKLDWLNREYIRKLSHEEFYKRARSFIKAETEKKFPDAGFRFALEALQGRISRLSEIEIELSKIVELPDYGKDLLLWRGKIREEEASAIIDRLITVLSGIEPSNFETSNIARAIEPLVEKHGKAGVLWPLRAALSGQEVSLGPYELATILGKDEMLRRLRIAQKKFKP